MTVKAGATACYVRRRQYAKLERAGVGAKPFGVFGCGGNGRHTLRCFWGDLPTQLRTLLAGDGSPIWSQVESLPNKIRNGNSILLLRAGWNRWHALLRTRRDGKTTFSSSTRERPSAYDLGGRRRGSALASTVPAPMPGQIRPAILAGQRPGSPNPVH